MINDIILLLFVKIKRRLIMDKLFKLKEFIYRIIAGLTTFFAMSYTLFVSPQILSQAGMPAQGVFLTTRLSVATVP